MKNPPRTTTIKGQKHLLAYITPDEANLLKAMGGSGEKVNGIPAFVDASFGGGLGSGYGNTTGNDSAEGGREDGMDSFDSGYVSNTPDVSDGQSGASYGISPGQSQAQFGTSKYAGLGQDQAIGQAAADNNPFAAGVAATRAKDIQELQNLNRQLQDLSRRKAIARSLPSLFGKVAQQNVSNLAMGLLGKDLSLGQAFGFSNLGLNSLNPSVSDLVAAQQNAITDAFGNVVGITDDYGTLQYGYDPNATGGPDRDDVVPTQTNPVTGQEECPDGYMFDEDLQACRLSADLPFGTPVTTPGPYDAGDYARMGLLDIAPMGMSLFADRYGIPQMDFDTANLAFRRAGATRPQYFRQAPDLTGYTLLA